MLYKPMIESVVFCELTFRKILVFFFFLLLCETGRPKRARAIQLPYFLIFVCFLLQAEEHSLSSCQTFI